jgi:hypothetical protein
MGAIVRDLGQVNLVEVLLVELQLVQRAEQTLDLQVVQVDVSSVRPHPVAGEVEVIGDARWSEVKIPAISGCDPTREVGLETLDFRLCSPKRPQLIHEIEGFLVVLRAKALDELVTDAR